MSEDRDESCERRAKKRRRLVTGCQNCRNRHYKCDTNMPSCSRCVEASVDCVRGINVRFRNYNNFAGEMKMTFRDSQIWLPSNEHIQYYDETPEVTKLYEEQPFAASAESSKIISQENDVILLDAPLSQDKNTPLASLTDFNKEATDQHSTFYAGPSHGGEMQILPGGETACDQETEIQTANQSQSTPISSSFSLESFDSPTYSYHDLETTFIDQGDQIATFTDREAFLMRNYTENMALWADITDIQRHFEIEVPRRALQHSVLRLAIFAFSSRHLSRHSDYDAAESLQYHNECLQLLIPKISDPNEMINENVLASIAILRQYEEMDTYDNRCHLIGTTRILNSISTFGNSGGLGEAAAWLCLRQDIYVSLVSQQPLKTHLANYLTSRTFQKIDDVSWANKMVFLLAKVLSFAFLPDQNSSGALQQISDEVEAWKLSRPATFNPIRFVARSREDNRPFPEIWLLSAFHVVALQYYHIARLVLAVSSRRSQSSGYENLREARRIEKIVRGHLIVILGLATFNKTAENTLFTARHTVSVWGGVFRDPMERDGVVSFLVDMEKRTGWRSAPLIQSLREQWEEDGDSD